MFERFQIVWPPEIADNGQLLDGAVRNKNAAWNWAAL